MGDHSICMVCGKKLNYGIGQIVCNECYGPTFGEEYRIQPSPQKKRQTPSVEKKGKKKRAKSKALERELKEGCIQDIRELQQKWEKSELRVFCPILKELIVEIEKL